MNKKFIFLISLNLTTLILIFLNDPIVQNQAYHNFVDTRSVLGHHNFFDCFSNILFLIFGGIGINYARVNYLSLSWKMFFISTALVALGSYYYHFNPNDQTLVWDRLPMTLAFMSLINAVFFETFKLKFERVSLLVLNLLGILSVLVWVLTKDLRFYYWIQLTPIISLLIIGLIFNKTLNIKTAANFNTNPPYFIIVAICKINGIKK